MHHTPEELKKSNGAQGEKSLKLEEDPVLQADGMSVGTLSMACGGFTFLLFSF
jgi:hypothetical protein